MAKSAKQGYELTFTCAQAFDQNYQKWSADKGLAQMKAKASETGDIGVFWAGGEYGGHKSALVVW